MCHELFGRTARKRQGIPWMAPVNGSAVKVPQGQAEAET